jgi:hypothetical protein
MSSLQPYPNRVSAFLAAAADEDAVLLAMEVAIQDEYKAELIYEGVVDDFGPVLPFQNIINAEIYEGYFDLDLPSDVRFVFENNQWASLERHLPAFQRWS